MLIHLQILYSVIDYFNLLLDYRNATRKIVMFVHLFKTAVFDNCLSVDTIEQVVMLELRRLSKCLCDDEESFAMLLVDKTNADILKEKKHIEGELQKCIIRSEQVAELCVQCYEDNVSGKLNNEMFMRFSGKYGAERLELKEKNSAYRKRVSDVDEMQLGKYKFIAAFRKFMQMDKLTAPLQRELIDRIDVFETEDKGKKTNAENRYLLSLCWICGGARSIKKVTHQNRHAKKCRGQISHRTKNGINKYEKGADLKSAPYINRIK